jgi:hypothetical protein
VVKQWVQVESWLRNTSVVHGEWREKAHPPQRTGFAQKNDVNPRQHPFAHSHPGGLKRPDQLTGIGTPPSPELDFSSGVTTDSVDTVRTPGARPVASAGKPGFAGELG